MCVVFARKIHQKAPSVTLMLCCRGPARVVASADSPELRGMWLCSCIVAVELSQRMQDDVRAAQVVDFIGIQLAADGEAKQTRN